MTAGLAARVVWVVLLATGYGLVVVSAVTREPVNDSGFVPGVALGCILITTGWLSALLVTAVAGRKAARTFGLLAVFVVVIGGPALVVWAPPDWIYNLPPEPRRGLGWIVIVPVLYLPVMTVVGGLAMALAWIADRTPLLRRMKSIEELRRQGIHTPSWFDPPSKTRP